MAKLPDNRRPFDPAKAMRERNAARAAAEAPEPTTPRKTPHRHGLRPLAPTPKRDTRN